MQVARDFAEVNGTRLYYEVAGAGHPLALVHGFSLDTRMWDDQIAPFAERYRVIRYDLRGFGKSALPTEEAYRSADDLKALLDHLGIERAHILGLSLGGWVAINFALAYPAMTSALIPVDSVLAGYRFSPDYITLNRSIFSMGRQQGISAAREAWLRHPLFQPALEQPHVAPRLRQIIGDYSGWHWANHDPEASPQPPAIDRLASIGAPALVIAGERDLPDFQAIADILATRIPHAQKVIIPGAGHMSNMEAPAAFNSVVLQFLDRLPQSYGN